MKKNNVIYFILGAVAIVLLLIFFLSFYVYPSARKINFFFLPTILIPITFAVMFALYPFRKQGTSPDRFGGKVGDIILIILATGIIFCSTVQAWYLIFTPMK